MQIKIKSARTKAKFSQIQIKRIEELASDMPINKVAEQFDMEEETFCEELRHQKAALQAYKKGRVMGTLRETKKLWKRMEEGDIGAIIFFSKLYGIWDDEQKYEVTNNRRTSPAFKIVMNKNT
jgi:hypothetical protein